MFTFTPKSQDESLSSILAVFTTTKDKLASFIEKSTTKASDLKAELDLTVQELDQSKAVLHQVKTILGETK